MSPVHPLGDASAHTLAHADLTAVFLPGRGMLGASLRHRGEELLGRVEDLANAAAKGSTAGVPFLHPWANRLSGSAYRAAGRAVLLDPSSPLLHFDEQGLPMHGVPWSRLAWTVTAASPDRITARLEWTRADLLAVFPFPHRVEMTASLVSDGLTVETILTAGSEGPVPVSFGFHPYLVLPRLPRREWRLELPALRKLVRDRRGIPTGESRARDASITPLGDLDLDDGYALLDEQATFAVSSGQDRLALRMLIGYTHAQVFAPRNRNYVAFEPMTAPTSALTTGDRLRLVDAGQTFQVAFKLCIDSNDPFPCT